MWRHGCLIIALFIFHCWVCLNTRGEWYKSYWYLALFCFFIHWGCNWLHRCNRNACFRYYVSVPLILFPYIAYIVDRSIRGPLVWYKGVYHIHMSNICCHCNKMETSDRSNFKCLYDTTGVIWWSSLLIAIARTCSACLSSDNSFVIH